MLLLRTLAGSRLYGTARPESDWDWYEVHDHVRARQNKTAEGLDTIKMPLSQWLRLCEKGTHQALDAMWCPPELTEVDRLGLSYRFSFRVDPWRVADQLRRTARALKTSRNSEKRDKHATMLQHCANRVEQFGLYDPSEWGRLSDDERRNTHVL